MKKTLLLIIILNLGFVAFGQEWTWPKRVKTTEGSNQYPDMVVDTNGIVHIVFRNYYWTNDTNRIYYTYSLDNGHKWEKSTNLIESNTKKFMRPRIACNDSSEVFVSYIIDSAYYRRIGLLQYDNTQWMPPFILTAGLAGESYSNNTVLDKENRLYVFWYNTAYNTYCYKYCEGGNWGNLYLPYVDSIGEHSFVDFALDTYNNLHWVGRLYNPDNPMLTKKTYYKYNKAQDQWYYPEYVTINYAYGSLYRDIAIDNAQNPHFVWIEKRDDPDEDWIDYTMYKSKINGVWSEQDTVVIDPWGQQIAIDGQNRVHLVHVEKTPNDGWQLMHYRKINNQWVGEIMDQANFSLGSTKLTYHNNMLFLSYLKSYNQGDPYYVYFMHYDIVTAVEENLQTITPNCKLYPNPFRNQINIEFETKQQGRVWVYVIDLKGNMVKELNNSELPLGKHRFKWDGTDMNKRKVANGSYLIRMVSGKYQLVKTVQLAN